MKTKTLINKYNKLVDKNDDKNESIKQLKHELNDVYSELHIVLASGFENDNKMNDTKDAVGKYKHRAEMAEQKYKPILGKFIKLQHIINRNSDDEMEFH